MSFEHDPLLRHGLEQSLLEQRRTDGESSAKVLFEPVGKSAESIQSFVDENFGGDPIAPLEYFVWRRVSLDSLEKLWEDKSAWPWLRDQGIRYIWPTLPLQVQSRTTLETKMSEALQTIRAGPQAHDGDGVTWAIIDSDVMHTHEALQDATITRMKVTDQGVVPSDPNFTSGCGHGTHLAGIIHMLAPKAKLVSIELDYVHGGDPCDLDDNGWLEVALEWVKNQEDIAGVNISLGLEPKNQDPLVGQGPGCVALNKCVDNGKIAVVAAGNYGHRSTHPVKEGRFLELSITDPANANRAFVVGASASSEPMDDGIWWKSSRGPTADGREKPDLVAPGVEIESCSHVADDAYATLSGSSMAAAFVSGALASFLVKRNQGGQPEKEPKWWMELLRDTAQNLGRLRTCQGAGLLRMDQAGSECLK